MTYHDTPIHGKPATAPPAKRSKQVSLTLQGGPRDGDRVTYGQPLPKTLVVSTNNGWQEYYRKPQTTTYIYANDLLRDETQ